MSGNWEVDSSGSVILETEFKEEHSTETSILKFIVRDLSKKTTSFDMIEDGHLLAKLLLKKIETTN